MAFLFALLLVFLYMKAHYAYRCVNFYGLEVPQRKFVCSWKHDPAWYLEKMKTNIHIDSVRLPFSYEYVSCSNMTDMDNFIDTCGKMGLQVILDYHRGYEDHQGPSPVEPGITKDMWINLLLTVLDRYEDKPHVKAIGLFNEFQGFDIKSSEDLQTEAVQAIEDAFPGRYDYMLSCIDWGKNCTNMWNTVPNNRSYVEMHSYGFSVGKPPTAKQKVFVGEIGWMPNQTDNVNQFKNIVMKKRIKDICLWTVAHSSDTKGLYQDDCETLNQDIADTFNSFFEWNHIPCLRGSQNQSSFHSR
jgi:Cellulase (glycosyl hydrolase family 5)